MIYQSPHEHAYLHENRINNQNTLLCAKLTSGSNNPISTVMDYACVYGKEELSKSFAKLEEKLTAKNPAYEHPFL